MKSVVDRERVKRRMAEEIRKKSYKDFMKEDKMKGGKVRKREF